MARRQQIHMIAGAVLITILACSLPGASQEIAMQPAVSIPTPLAGQLLPGGSDLGFEHAAEWPGYIPQDIPRLEGKIRNMMVAPQSHIRIFYEDLTKAQIDAYLRLLEQQGFHLEYQVYVEEGFPDTSEERIKKGDFDAVDITKGEYHMNIAYGEGDIAYDIYTSGFAQAIPTSAGLDWPAELATLAPKPEGCLVQSVFPDSTGGYQITCRPIIDGEVADDYVQALQAAGFLPVESSIVGPSQVYGKDALEIIIEQHSTALVLIWIRRIDLSKTSWPVELAGHVPPPAGCPITQVLKTEVEELKFLISCQSESDHAVTDYIALLLSEGFVETRRMEAKDGVLLSAEYQKGRYQVRLLLGQLSRMTIDVSVKP